MADQHVVVLFPTPGLFAEAVGPFRSVHKARAARRALAAALEREDYGLVPQVVKLTTVAAAIRDYAPDPELND